MPDKSNKQSSVHKPHIPTHSHSVLKQTVCIYEHCSTARFLKLEKEIDFRNVYRGFG